MLYLISLVLISFCGIEIYLDYLLNHPKKIPLEWIDKLKYYYKYHNINNIQYAKGMSQYDSTLFYTLQPGEFTFENREFSTPFFVNSIGCRDDEASLAFPEMVVLGDSYSMGWGINKDEIYSSLIVEQVMMLNTFIKKGTRCMLQMHLKR